MGVISQALYYSWEYETAFQIAKSTSVYLQYDNTNPSLT